MPVLHNAHDVARDLTHMGAVGQREANKVTRRHARILETRIKGKASGRPGPRVITGNYRRSWTTQHAGPMSIIGSNAPQARRLEWGFQGPDSLGRVYNQPPYPHVGPAYAEVQPLYLASLAEIPGF